MDMLEHEVVPKWGCYSNNCLKKFVKIFVQPKFRECTFITLNAKGCDGYLILRQLIHEKVQVPLLTQAGKLLCTTCHHLRFDLLIASFCPLN